MSDLVSSQSFTDGVLRMLRVRGQRRSAILFWIEFSSSFSPFLRSSALHFGSRESLASCHYLDGSRALVPSDRASNHIPHHPHELRMVVDRLCPGEREPDLACERCRLGVEVIERLDVIDEEADRAQDGR